MSENFAERLAAATPTPGGGAAAARVALYSSSLLRMVLGLTAKKLEDDPLREALDGFAAKAAEIAVELRQIEDDDVAAFDGFMSALRMPRGTDDQKAARREARREAARRAAEVPMRLLERSCDLLRLIQSTRQCTQGRKLSAASDLEAAVELAGAALKVAHHTVAANLDELPLEEAVTLRETVDRVVTESERIAEELRGSG